MTTLATKRLKGHSPGTLLYICKYRNDESMYFEHAGAIAADQKGTIMCSTTFWALILGTTVTVTITICKAVKEEPGLWRDPCIGVN